VPLAVSSAVRFSLRRARRPQLSDRATPLLGFRSPPEYYPANPSRPAGAGRLLSWASAPFSARGFGGPPHAGLPRPLSSARRVWLPSRRLAPSEPVPVLFHTGGALGIRPSELSPPARYPGVSARKDPRTVSPAVVTVARATGRPGRPRFLGFDPCRSPWRPNALLARRPLAAPLGLTLLGSAGGSLGRDYARPPLARLPETPGSGSGHASESRSASAWPCRWAAAHRSPRAGQPF
jgi:hypothetical protein